MQRQPTRRDSRADDQCAVLAVVQGLLVIAANPSGIPVERLTVGVLTQSSWVAWAYLLAEALEKMK